MDPDRLERKLLDLNASVSKELRKAQIREFADQMVLDGKWGYDPETDQYWRLLEDGDSGGA
jgi:hypothetical protein